MKNLYLRVLLLLIVLIGFSTSNSYASHIPGANITYTCDPANPLTYTFTFTIFRKCPGTHPTTMSAANFSLTNDCGLTNPVVPTFNQVGVAQDVNQLCNTATSNCSGGTQPGVWKYTYEATITLPADCDSWNLAFELCCRDQSSNLTGTTGNDMACSTTLNTLTAPCNNSPVVTAQPIPYACTNTNFNYCLTIADPEGDSTYFSMVAPAGNAQAPIAHLAGFSAAAPLNNFVLDPLTGCISFNHPNIGNYVVAIQINSYDAAGNLIASIIHDFQIMVIACTNTPPTNPAGGISNVTGTGSQVGPNTVAACYGDNICFDVVFQDLADPGNSITINQDGTTLLPGATFVQTGTNPATGTFCWTSQPGATGNVVTFIAEDDGCPVMGTSGFAVNFNISTGVYAGADQTICGAQGAQLSGFGAGTYTWTPATGLSCTNCPNPIASPASTTTYTVTGNLTGACANTDQVTVNVVADYALTATPANATICANEIIQINANGQAGFGPFTYNWTPAATLNNDSIFNPFANPITSTSYTATVTAANGCTKQVTSNINISGIGPTVTVTPSDTDICAGEAVPLNSTAFVYPLTCGLSAGCSGNQSDAIVGTGTASSSTYSPFYGSTATTTDYTKKIQYIYTAAELNALGYTGGTIENLALFNTTINTYRYDNVRIWIGCTSQSEYASGTFIPTSSLTQVFGATNNIDPTDNGWHDFDIQDWDWDGTSNLVIQFCSQEDGAGNVGTNSVRYTSTSPAYRSVYNFSSTVVSCNETLGTRTLSRANIRFRICTATPVSPTYSWTTTTGLNNPSIANPTATPGTTTSYVLSVTAAGCTGSTIAQVNVSPDYTINPTANNNNICYGTSVSLSGNPSGAGPYTYNWAPNGAFASPTASNPSVTPTGPTTYYLSTSNGFCDKLDSVTVNVAGVPVSVTASKDTVCAGETINLNTVSAAATCGVNYSNCTGTSSSAVSATGTAASSTYGPFYGSTSTTLVYTNKKQYIFTAAELTAMGFSAGMITRLELDVSTSTGRSYDDMDIFMGCTSQDNYPTTSFIPTTSLVQVYSATKYTTTVGWNAFNITGYDWDGTSNIVIQFCSSNPDQTGSESVRYTTTTPSYQSLYYNSSSVLACGNPTGTRTYLRPNMRFTMCSSSFGAGSTYSWSPTNVSNPNIQNPTASVGGNSTYTITVTDPANPACTTTGSVNVYIDTTNSVRASNDTTICPTETAFLTSSFSGNIPTTIPCGANATVCGGANYNTTWGTGTTSGCCPTIYYGSQTDQKCQLLYRASDLTAAGLSSGTISAIAFDVATHLSTGPYQNFTIRMGCTSLNALTTTYVTTGFTTVYTPKNTNIVAGWNTHNFDVTYDWDGTSNLIFEICFDNPATISYDYVRYTTTSYTSLIRSYNSTNSTSGCAYTGTATYSYSSLPNIRFTSCNPPTTTPAYTWTPTTDLSNPNIANPTATPTTNMTYVVRATGGICDVYDTVNVIMCPVLPIELLSFNAECVENNVVLNWATASEINNDHFTIERSSDGIKYTAIATIKGNGNSNTVLDYTWTDNHPQEGTNYYRLKQTDFNGDFEYFGVSGISCGRLSEVAIYPNPFNNSFTVQLPENASYPVHIKIVDYLGRNIYDQTIEKNHTVIDMEDLALGTYYIIVSDNKTQVSERIVKMK